MEEKITLEAEEVRTMGYGAGVALPGDNKPWEKMTPEGLSGESLLKKTPNIPFESLEFIMDSLSRMICRAMQWDFELEPRGALPVVIVDIISTQSGQITVIMQWKYDVSVITGHGGSGEAWKEARATIDITNDQEGVSFIVGKINEKLEHEERYRLEDLAFQAALKNAGLDRATLEARQRACLLEAGLDWQTLGEKVRVFTENWKAERGAEKRVVLD